MYFPSFVQRYECEKIVELSLTLGLWCNNMYAYKKQNKMIFVSYYLFFLFLFVFPDKTRADAVSARVLYFHLGHTVWELLCWSTVSLY